MGCGTHIVELSSIMNTTEENSIKRNSSPSCGISLEEEEASSKANEEKKIKMVEKKGGRKNRTNDESDECAHPCMKHCKATHKTKNKINKNKLRDSHRRKQTASAFKRQRRTLTSSPPSQSPSSPDTTHLCCGINVQQCLQHATNWLMHAIQMAFIQHRTPSSFCATYYDTVADTATSSVHEDHHVSAGESSKEEQEEVVNELFSFLN